MRTAVPKITIRRESDFVDVVPIMLGFVPNESLVAIFLQPDTSTAHSVRLVARMDLPTSNADLAQAVTVLTTHGAGTPVVLVAYSTDLDRGVQAMEELHKLWAEGDVLAAIAVVDDDRYVIDDQGDPWQVAGSDADRIAAEAVLAGVPLPLPSREALGDTITRPTIEVAEHTDHATTPTRSVGGCLDSVGMIAWLTHRSRDGWPLPSRDELITLIASVQEIDVRDAAWLSISRADAHQHLVLWRQAAALVDGPASLPVLGLLGMAAWIDSQGALANLVLDRARTTEGFADYTIFGLLEEILGRGMDPACWESLRPTPAELQTRTR